MKKVGEITHARSGLTVPIFIEKTTFVCDCLETRFTAPDAKILEAKVQDFIQHWLTLDWYPVIKVESATNDGWGHSKKVGLWLTCERMYLSRSPAGQILRVTWDSEPAHRKALCSQMPDRELRLAALPLGAPLQVGKSVTWMDYTDARWLALKAINTGIEKMAETLAVLLTTSAGNAKLENYQAPLMLLEQGNKELTDRP